ncbi:MAG: hypothetical protein U9Q88_15875 [Bacillota bacterium]|nr:hypothetical protein [Bacillota bacterium]
MKNAIQLNYKKQTFTDEERYLDIVLKNVTKRAFVIDFGINYITLKMKVKSKSGYLSQQEAEDAANTLFYALEQRIYLEETGKTFSDFSETWLPIYSESKDNKPGTIRVPLHEVRRLLP